MFWRLTKKDIIDWLEWKEQKFAWQEKNDTWTSDKQWMQMYVFMDLHEIFFGEFPKKLTEWLERLVEKTWSFSVPTPKNWTHELVTHLNSVSNPTTRAIDFWLDSVPWGYVTEFAIDFIQSYSVAERNFFKGLHGRFLKSLNTRIKMLLCEKHVMIMKSDG